MSQISPDKVMVDLFDLCKKYQDQTAVLDNNNAELRAMLRQFVEAVGSERINWLDFVQLAEDAEKMLEDK